MPNWVTGMLRKGTIAVDFDEVLYGVDVINKTLKENGIEPKIVRTWELKEVPPEVVEIIRKRFRDPSYMCDPKLLISGSVDAVKRLARLGYRLIIVTGRAWEIERATKLFVRKFFPDIDEIFLVGLGGDKTEILKKQNVRLLIDDAPHNIEAAANNGIPFILISNATTCYNHDFAQNLRCRFGRGVIATSLSVVASRFEKYKNPPLDKIFNNFEKIYATTNSLIDT